MTITELDTFIRKFNQLWQAGLTAHLDLDTHAGSAWVGLRVQLGHVAPGPLHQVHQQHQAFRRVSPSRERRRARRLAAREQFSTTTAAAEKAAEGSEEECADKIEQIEQSNFAEEANTSVVDSKNLGGNPEHEAEKAESEEAGKADDLYQCEICDFKSTWKNGLEIHMGRKHCNIEQLDGLDDELDKVDRYDNTEHYWKSGRIGMAYHSFLDAIQIIDSSDIPEHEKKTEKEKLLDARKSAFGKNFSNYPPWKK